MRVCVLFGFILCSFYCWGQELELSGKIYGYDADKNSKLYYTTNGKSFNEKRFITYDSTRTYSLCLSGKEIKKKRSKTLDFSLTPDASPKASYSCIYKINLAEIKQSEDFKSQKLIRMKANVSLDANCLIVVHQKIKKDGIEQLSGIYKMSVGDTIFKFFFRGIEGQEVSLQKIVNSSVVNKAKGFWSYEPDKKILKIKLDEVFNPELDCYVDMELMKVYTFKWKEEAGGILVSDQGTLRR
ncbi:hypothetical protein QNI19_17695 [Cytophagaceae bacterium DM2B3-1]|uniref:DUF3108 domain-containing protein n=1 Tax=Xanthocytophaga flava TaxID=3048013 RepID=A0ABT7CM17_9BACT|nr:hypothetical protein [Xanthocytophaga flavus]MDJ1494777.1 hypothetical protein [Xanthocytophaga flavus]